MQKVCRDMQKVCRNMLYDLRWLEINQELRCRKLLSEDIML